MKCRHCSRHITPAPEWPTGQAWRHTDGGMRYCNGYPDSPLAEPETTPDEQEPAA